MSRMTASAPPDQDERPLAMANDRRVVVGLVAAIWVGLGGLLWLVMLGEEGAVRATLLASTIVGTAALTAHAVIAVHSRRALGPWRWPVMALVLGLLGWLSHLALMRLGMVQSLIQDLVNMTVVTGVALAISQAWSGHRARQDLTREAALRASAEARLAEGRLRPTGLLPVKVGHGERMVDPALVSHVEAEGNFSTLHLATGSVFVSEALKDMVLRLEPYGFVRVHKSHAVNAEWIVERRRDAVVLRSGISLPVGRAYRT